MMVNHPDELLPLEFLAQIHTTLTEAQLMKVDLDAIIYGLSWRFKEESPT